MATSYGSTWSDQQQQAWNTLEPLLQYVYSPDRLNTNASLWDIPNLSSWMPDVADYTAGGQQWQSAYDKIAPAYMNTYENLMEQNKNSLANAGTLGSPYGGTSGVAADVLSDKMNEWASTINKDVTTNVQGSLDNAYSTTANAVSKYFEEYMKQQQYPYEQYASLLTSAYPTTTATTSSDSGGSK